MVERANIRTYEELVMNRISKAFDSMDAGSAEVFDEIIDEIEMLLKLVPELYEQFEQAKVGHDALATQAFAESAKKIAALDDPYVRDFKETKDTATISWDYRKDMLESIINILGQNSMIPFASPVYSTIETIPEAGQGVPPEVPQTIEELPTEEPPAPPVPVEEKPEEPKQTIPLEEKNEPKERKSLPISKP